MAFLDELGRTITKTSQTVAKKAKDIAEISNLKLQVKEEERQRREIYAKIGEKYCALHGDEPEEALAEEFQKLEQINQRIEALKENIASLDHARICPNCSSKLPERGMFCPICGTKYPEQEKEEEVVEAEAVEVEESEETEASQTEEIPAEDEETASETDAEGEAEEQTASETVKLEKE